MYSNADMITNVVDETGNVTKYEFDTLDRLTKEINGDNITSYSYDLAGNRTQKIVTTNQTNHTNNYTLGIGNRLASWGTNGVARYNAAGCLTNMVSNIDGRELNLSWNERYQLTSVDVLAAPESGTAEAGVLYDYNVLGQRISRKEITGSTTNIEYYIHDGVNVVADLDENKELLISYSYTPGYDNIISMTTYGDTATNTYFYIRNHNNSVVALIDEDGDIAESYEYSAFGEVSVFDANGNELDESAIGNRYTFQGREIDYTTGLYNFRARWYDAETGRWLSKDPIGINGGLNQYVFCGNNPVMFADPEGLFRFGKRPLEGPLGCMYSQNPIDDYFNTEVLHEHGFFEDGIGGNIGFGPDGRFSENTDCKEYRYDDTHYDDALMREALKNVQDGEYNLLGWGKGAKNNCQDWAERLRDEYEDLKKERAGENSK